MGLYRENGLFILCKINTQKTERIRKKDQYFQKYPFYKEFVTNLTEVDFLDVTFNLEHNTYHPYSKTHL